MLRFAFILFMMTFSTLTLAQPKFLGSSSEEQYICAHDGSKVYCWGSNEYGRVVNIDGYSHIKQIETEFTYGCVSDDTGMSCWGEHPELSRDLLNNPDIEKFKLSASDLCALVKGKLLCAGTRPGDAPNDLNNITDFSLNENLTCVVRKGKPYCWGKYGISNIPNGLGHVVKIDVRTYYICVLNNQNQMHCWGSGFAEMNEAVPTTKEKIVDFQLADDQACFLTDKGSIKCWGKPGDIRPEVLQTKVARSLTVNNDFSCMVDLENKHFCWGLNLNRMEEPLVIKNVSSFSTYSEGTCFGMEGEISCTGEYRIASQQKVEKLSAIFADFDVLCFIDSGAAQCQNKYSTLKIPPSLTQATQFAIGEGHICGITKEARVECWERLAASYPITAPSSLGGVKKILNNGGNVYCALTNANQVKCWGESVKQPLLRNGDKIKDVAIGGHHLCALYDMDTIECSSVTVETSRTPMNPPDHLFGIQGVFGGSSYVCAYTTKEIYCWGSDKDMNLPPKVSGKIKSIDGSEDHACFQDDKGIRCWGKLDRGEDQFFEN